MNNNAKKDLLIIVPDYRSEHYRRIIRHTVFAVKSRATYDVMSGDDFARTYGPMTAEQVVHTLREKYVEVSTIGDLSKREQKAYDAIIKPAMEYAQAHPLEAEVVPSVAPVVGLTVNEYQLAFIERKAKDALNGDYEEEAG